MRLVRQALKRLSVVCLDVRRLGDEGIRYCIRTSYKECYVNYRNYLNSQPPSLPLHTPIPSISSKPQAPTSPLDKLLQRYLISLYSSARLRLASREISRSEEHTS